MRRTSLIPVAVILSAVVFCSCIPLLSINKGEEGAIVLRNDDAERTVIFVPMIHVQKQNFYDKTGEYLDELKVQGFVVFYEEVRNRDTSEEVRDELLEYEFKFRKLTGIYPSQNEKKHGALRRGRYVMQTNEMLGLTTEQDIWADMYVEDLIDIYESKYGEIILTDYDRETPFNEDYEWDRNRYRNANYELLIEFRDKYLSNMIRDSEHPKIAVVFGSAHYYISLRASLRDMGFTEISKRDLRKERKANK